MAVSRSMIASPTLECGKRHWEDSSSLFVDSRVAFETLGDDLVANVFSFAIAPTSLPTLCACSQKCKGAAWQPNLIARNPAARSCEMWHTPRTEQHCEDTIHIWL